jgi:hypothetical protein
VDAHAGGPRAGAESSGTKWKGFVREAAGQPASGNVAAPNSLIADRSVTDEPP